MTATKRDGDALGRYYTPAGVARATVRRLFEAEPSLARRPLRALDPCAGGGAWLEALAAERPREGLELFGLDLDPDAPAVRPFAIAARPWRRAVGNALDPWPWAPPDLVIGNPPYTVIEPGPGGKGKAVEVASSHVRAALERTNRHAVFLLRCAFLGSRGRLDLWTRLDAPLRQVFPVVPRPSFTEGGTDSDEYAVLWWDRAWSEPAAQVGWIVWR